MILCACPKNYTVIPFDEAERATRWWNNNNKNGKYKNKMCCRKTFGNQTTDKQVKWQKKKQNDSKYNQVIHTDITDIHFIIIWSHTKFFQMKCVFILKTTTKTNGEKETIWKISVYTRRRCDEKYIHKITWMRITVQIFNELS